MSTKKEWEKELADWRKDIVICNKELESIDYSTDFKSYMKHKKKISYRKKQIAKRMALIDSFRQEAMKDLKKQTEKFDVLFKEFEKSDSLGDRETWSHEELELLEMFFDFIKKKLFPESELSNEKES